MPLRIRESVILDSDVQIEGNLIARGAIASEHDAIYWFPPDFVSTGGVIDDAASTSMFKRVTFDPGVNERLKFMWVPPIQWINRDFTIRVGWMKEVAGSGNVVWQYSHTLFYLGGNPSGTLSPFSSLTRAVPGGNPRANWDYFDIASFATPTGFFGEMPYITSSVERLATNAADTYASDTSVFTVTATAEPVPDI